ncbi:AAA family ATPase [Lactimicrobium massiliense]|uniref:AAA family ATPase n=1 Tax=Lactimicrobium massiliense TaxID=2161814 RepID=UPI000D562781|nr:AAA family ATPase [Lactimicrobium massiliense]
MKKITIFWGPNSEYKKLLPKTYTNLTTLALRLDKENRTFELRDPSRKDNSNHKKPRVKTFVVSADEYCSVNEHIITNFNNFLAQFACTEMFIQNPPKAIKEQLFRTFDGCINEQIYQYPILSEDIIRNIYRTFDLTIIGQESVKMELLKALFPAINKKQKKPVVILLYGPSGVGKTETARYLAEILNGNLLRKQFSMFQGGEFANYLFGGKYNEKSFAQDLMARESNVILLDEFDKANPIFHSAFYQLFDDGVYADPNYEADVNNAIIICTSNYSNRREIEEKLGAPIYNRFDAIIEFDELTTEAKKKIAEIAIRECEKDFKAIVLSDQTKENLIKKCASLSNARAIQRIVKETFSLLGIRHICNSE